MQCKHHNMCRLVLEKNDIKNIYMQIYLEAIDDGFFLVSLDEKLLDLKPGLGMMH